MDKYNEKYYTKTERRSDFVRLRDLRKSVEQQKDYQENVVRIPLDRLRCSPFQPRKIFQTLSLNELSESIREFGVLQPILVRDMGDGYYEIISGERRYRASLIAGKTDIPAIVLSINDNEAAIHAIVENIQREDLDYMELAEAYNRLIVEHGMTQEEVARRVGKSQSAIANKIRLLRLSPNVVKVLSEHGLTERHARALLRLPNEQLQLKVLKIVTDRAFSVAETELLISKTLEAAKGDKKSDSYFSQGKGASKVQEKHPGVKDALNEIDSFISGIKKSVAVFKQLGINAKTAQFDRDTYFEIVVRLPKELNGYKYYGMASENEVKSAE